MCWASLFEAECTADRFAVAVVARSLWIKQPNWKSVLKHIVSQSTSFTKTLKWPFLPFLHLYLVPANSLPVATFLLLWLPLSFLWDVWSFICWNLQTRSKVLLLPHCTQNSISVTLTDRRERVFPAHLQRTGSITMHLATWFWSQYWID